MTGTEPQTHVVTDADGVRVFVHQWGDTPNRGVVHVLHGMGEHSRRYDHVAGVLVNAGFVVYADDHRASGRTGAEGLGLGDLGPRGMLGALDSVHDVYNWVRARHPDTASVLLGHSWGSALAQAFAIRWGEELDGLVLSGTTLARPGGRRGDPNSAFEPAATPYDWLSRDPEAVRRYIEDPWCGMEVAFPRTEIGVLRQPPSDAVPSALPVLVINGSDDPVGGREGGEALTAAYREAGVSDVTLLCYEGGRHEMFNETNKDEVLGDLVAWLEDRF